MNKKIGLVLSGGGGKGAYEIGVWKALREMGLDKQIVAVSGTSIGALNSALFLQGDLEQAEKTWLSIAPEKILSVRADRMLQSMALAGFAAATRPVVVALSQRVAGHGVFSREGLLEIIRNDLDLSLITESPIPAFAACYEIESDSVRYFRLNGCDEERIISILLATSALPGIFGKVEIDGKDYLDGGLTDNSPITPLYQEMNCDVILLVSLSRDFILEHQHYPGVRVLPIVPRADPGGLITGTLDFTSEGAARRMLQGYQDAYALLSRLELLLNNEAEYQRLWEEIAEGEKNYQKAQERQNKAEEQHISILRAVSDFNRLIVNDQLEDDLDFEVVPERDLLTEANRNLLERIERENIRIRVDDFLDKNRDNGYAIQDSAIEAIAYLAPVEGRSKHLQEQGGFARLWGEITGKNQKVSAANQKDLAMAQYAAMSLMQRIHQKGLLTLEFSAALNNRTNLLFTEIARTNERLNEHYIDVYRSLGLLFVKFRRELMKDRHRIEQLEDRVSQLEWLSRIKVHTLAGVDYRHLSLSARMICLVNDFYRLTEGAWNLKEIQSLRAAMVELDMAEATLTLGDFLAEMSQKPNLKRRCIEGLYSDSEDRQDKSSLLALVETQNNDHNDLETELPVFTMALELLGNMQRVGYQVPKEGELEGLKKLVQEQLDFMQALAQKHKAVPSLLEEIAITAQELQHFAITVPLIGAFSSGKSTLLNAYLGSPFLATDLGAETCVATELHPARAGEEKLVLHYISGERREYPLSEYARIKSIAETLRYLEVHLDNPALRTHPDIILVDMPGLDSVLENHNRAILNYVREGVSFIVCVDIQLGLKESVLNFLSNLAIYKSDFSLLLTKLELKAPGELAVLRQQNQSIVARLAERDVFTGLVSANQNQFQDFQHCLRQIEESKDLLLQQRFSGSIKNLASKLVNHLQILMNRENLSILDLQEKKGEIERSLKELDHLLQSEISKLQEQCRNQLPDQIVNDVRGVLELNRASLKSAAKQNSDLRSRVEGLVMNTFRLAVTERSQRLFAETSARLGRYISSNIYGSLEGGPGGVALGGVGNLDTGSMSFVGGSVVAGLTGMIILGPIGLLLGPIVGFFVKKKQDDKLDGELTSMISQVSSSIRGEALRCLEETIGRFSLALTEKVEQVKEEMRHSIALLEEQIQKGDDKIIANRQEIATDVDGLKTRLASSVA